MGNLTVTELHDALPEGNYLDWLVVDDVLHQILVDANHLTKPIRHLRIRMRLEDQLTDRLPQLPPFIRSAYAADKANCMLYLFRDIMKLKGDLQARCRQRRLALPAHAAAKELGTFTELPANVISKHSVETNARRAGKPETRHQSNWRYYYTDDGDGGRVVCRLLQGMYGAFLEKIRGKRGPLPSGQGCASAAVAGGGEHECGGEGAEGGDWRGGGGGGGVAARLVCVDAFGYGRGLLARKTLMVLFTLGTGDPAPNCGACMGRLLEMKQLVTRSPRLEVQHHLLHTIYILKMTHILKTIYSPNQESHQRRQRAKPYTYTPANRNPPTNNTTRPRIVVPRVIHPLRPPPPPPQPTITPALSDRDRDSPPARPSTLPCLLNTPAQPDCAETARRSRRHLAISPLLN
ncbi:hypothetical protein BO99DRAFT_470343 [Aspergillus violaceofuscus CBS 115571]|uniref:Uncharacterized protein n=1 Tax=Aspergillus violaceofuscus (strain CBS 115571) TaxID=1450538 RepID=A0A2V5HNM4_ASPV1|nr:hypothetical protein BO99DRAFT_470343 [Aspergillus violaceofuscus CBS 115571]